MRRDRRRARDRAARQRRAATGIAAHAPARAVDAAAPRTVAADDNVPVTFTAQHDTGVVGRSGHGYAVSAMAVAPAVACVNNRDAFSRTAPRPGPG